MALTADDIVAIQQLAYRYNHTVDSGDGDGFANCFVEDGVLDVGTGPIVGRAKLAKVPAGVARMNSARHMLSNVLVDGDGDEATVKAYLMMVVSDGDPSAPVIRSRGRYVDSVRRTPQGWKFVTREFTPDK